MRQGIGNQVGITSWKYWEGWMPPLANLSPLFPVRLNVCGVQVYRETCALEWEWENASFSFPAVNTVSSVSFPLFLSVLQRSPETWNAGKKKNTNCLTRGVTYVVKNGWSWNESIRETNWGTCHAVNNRETTLLSAFITGEDVAAASQRARPQSVSVFDVVQKNAKSTC